MGVGGGIVSRRSDCGSTSPRESRSTLGSPKVGPAGLLKGIGVRKSHVVFLTAHWVRRARGQTLRSSRH